MWGTSEFEHVNGIPPCDSCTFQCDWSWLLTFGQLFQYKNFEARNPRGLRLLEERNNIQWLKRKKLR
jgi:hypothetical protein